MLLTYIPLSLDRLVQPSTCHPIPWNTYLLAIYIVCMHNLTFTSNITTEWKKPSGHLEWFTLLYIHFFQYSKLSNTIFYVLLHFIQRIFLTITLKQAGKNYNHCLYTHLMKAFRNVQSYSLCELNLFFKITLPYFRLKVIQFCFRMNAS